MSSEVVTKQPLTVDTNLSGSARARVPTELERRLGNAALPLIGVGVMLLLWAAASATLVESLPSPRKTWEVSRLYILEPFEKRGELDQGILRFTWYSLQRVAKGY